MTKANKKGRIGSQRLLQVAVAQYPDLLRKALQKAGAIKESENVLGPLLLKKISSKSSEICPLLKKLVLQILLNIL